MFVLWELACLCLRGKYSAGGDDDSRADPILHHGNNGRSKCRMVCAFVRVVLGNGSSLVHRRIWWLLHFSERSGVKISFKEYFKIGYPLTILFACHLIHFSLSRDPMKSLVKEFQTCFESVNKCSDHVIFLFSLLKAFGNQYSISGTREEFAKEVEK